ncbi:MAG TPA: hypothetical protein VGE98_13685, partial [Thermoanaerobaculia bacterium]
MASQLLVFHQSAGDSGELWYNTFDGSGWRGDQQVADTSLSDSPSAVVFNDLYCFHQGIGDDGQL